MGLYKPAIVCMSALTFRKSLCEGSQQSLGVYLDSQFTGKKAEFGAERGLKLRPLISAVHSEFSPRPV